MKAAFINKGGAPDEFIYGDVPDPAPGPGEILIRVRAAAVNHLDTVIRSGIRPYLKISPPHVLGYEAAGEVAAIGAGVTKFAVGDKVVANTKTGAYAELALADAGGANRVPEGMSFEDAAPFAATGPTAYRMAIRRAQVRAGETVLVTAAASGTGSMILQIAKAAGARVIATAGGARKLELVKSLGADEVIDHYEEKVGERLLELTGGLGADAAIDAVSSQPLFEAILQGLRPGGRMVIYGNIVSQSLNFNVRTVFSKGLTLMGGQGADPRLAAAERQIDAAALVQLADTAKLRFALDRSLTISQAQQAHELMESHTVAGKLILTA